MKPSEVKLFFDGQRIHDNETPDSLGFNDGDTVEVFTEMLGGGPSPKGNIYGHTDKILELLENEFQSDKFDEISSDEESEATSESTEHKDNSRNGKIESNEEKSKPIDTTKASPSEASLESQKIDDGILDDETNIVTRSNKTF